MEVVEIPHVTQVAPSTVTVPFSEQISEQITKQLDLAVLIPAYNEEEGIGPTLEEMKQVLGGMEKSQLVVVVDGNSTDGTAQIAQSSETFVVKQTGTGKGQAVVQALRLLPENTKYVVMTDADYTYPARFIPVMLDMMENDPSIGMICGDRFDKTFVLSKAMKSTFYAGNRLLSFMQYVSNGVRMRDPLTGLRVMRYELLRDWAPKSQGFDIEAELNNYIHSCGFKIEEIPIEYRPRLGKKKLGLRQGFPILKRILFQALSS
jgi:dolichol-phosphate mannosyltransferase